VRHENDLTPFARIPEVRDKFTEHGFRVEVFFQLVNDERRVLCVNDEAQNE